jgi:hypothetical protein
MYQNKLQPLEVVPQEVSSQEYGSTTTKIGKYIQIGEHRIKEVHLDQIDPTSKLQQHEQP